MVKRVSETMEKEEQQPFIEECLPKIKLEFSYLWMNYQARKRKYFKKNQTKMPIEMTKKTKKEIEEQPKEEKLKWAQNLLRKLKKDIKPESRDEFVKAVKGIKHTNCVLTNPDQKGKMRRIDCLRQADKVWRLDLVIMVLFHAAPLESTDGERLARMPVCKQKALCINPHHIGLLAKGLDIYLSNYLYKKDIEGSPNIILTGILIKDKTTPVVQEKSPPYSELEVFHKELPPVKIRINDRCHPFLQHAPSTDLLDINNNNNNDSDLQVTKDHKNQEEHLNQSIKMYKNSMYSSIYNRTIARPSQKQRSFSSPSPRAYSFDSSNEIDIDLEQSMIYSYPQNGCSTNQFNHQNDFAINREATNRNYQQSQVSSFPQSHYQHQQISNYTSTMYVPPIDYNSSCGSEISSASMASYNSENSFPTHNYQQPSHQQPSVNFYYDAVTPSRFYQMPLHNIPMGEVASKTNFYTTLGGYPSS
ncbi:uncharacterized protein LOC100200021 isoform X1 [Hydra vulgaris]|uniref:uncharacterized protein LOC100200021 isoform X1 n=2 Tax=Hydra vulgaris TaxID=6087 RepID=UPI001F5F8F11|nr:uncharacterized protein LOC100200021 isoform X1 [Hydra vulgaris]